MEVANWTDLATGTFFESTIQVGDRGSTATPK